MEKVDLGKEKISKLLLSFSVPCIISLIVNALYNIVDQIFIGWGVGYLGNGATNVVFPITVICLAFALMFGDGSSAYLSLKLGENKKEEANKKEYDLYYLDKNCMFISFTKQQVLSLKEYSFVLSQLINFKCLRSLTLIKIIPDWNIFNNFTVHFYNECCPFIFRILFPVMIVIILISV